MGKPLSRPDCLRQNPRCLGKGDEDEAYIEDCYVPQRSIYDTMRINEQIDQGTKLCQPSRSTLGSGGEVRGEGSTLSSNGTIAADLGGVFVSRSAESAGGVRKLDERVIFDALKLTGDAQIMSPPVGIVGSGLPIASSSGAGGVAAVAKRRHQGGDKKDNPNRRSWKAFMPPSYPEFAERLELSSAEGAEKRLSGAGVPTSVPHLPPTTPTSSTPTLPPYTPSPLSSAPHTPPVPTSPLLTPTISPVPPFLQHPLSRLKQVHPALQKQQREAHAGPSPSKEQVPALSRTRAPQRPGNSPQHSPGGSRQVDRTREEHRRTASSSKAGVRQISEEPLESVKTSDSERDSPLLDQDQGDNAPLIPPKPVFCPPTKARTWPRGLTTGKRTPVGLRHNFPVLPPLPPLLGEDNTDEESLYLLDPPSPFLKEEEGLIYGGLPLSPCISQEGCDEGLLGWGAQAGDLRERTASELKFEEDERRILLELEEEEQEEAAWMKERSKAEEERAEREEREWEAVLKLENREIIEQAWHRDTLDSEGWDLTGSSGHWPVLTPPTGFGGPGGPSASPGPSSEAESDDLFLELERQCEEDEGEEGVEMSVDPEPLDPYLLPYLEEEEGEEEAETVFVDFEGTLPIDAVRFTEPDGVEPGFDKSAQDFNHSEHEMINFDLIKVHDHQKEHGFIDEDCDVGFKEEGKLEEEEMSYPTDSALGQLLESDSSGVHMSQPDRTGTSTMTQTDREQEKPAQAETDLDSGASSEHEDYGESASSPARSPLNPYAEEEEEAEQDEAELKKEEELETEWDVYDQSEPSLDSSEGVLTDHSLEPPHTAEKETDDECKQDVDVQTSCCETRVPSDFIQPSVPIIFDPQGTSSGSDTENLVVPADEASGLDLSELGPDLEAPTEVTASTPKSEHAPAAPPASSPQTKSDFCGAGLGSKDSEAFVISDSFVYLAVSAPTQYPSDYPPSEDSVPPSPVPKPPCCQDPEEEEGSFLSPDSFVYMAAPERPQAGPSDVGSACEDTQEQDLDSYSEGTQSGMEGVEFVLGSMTGDSDWESDSSALDVPPLMSRDQAWDQLEPGLLPSLFAPAETVPAGACGPLAAAPADPCSETERGSDSQEESAASPCFSLDAQSEVSFHFTVIQMFLEYFRHSRGALRRPIYCTTLLHCSLTVACRYLCLSRSTKTD